MSVSKLSEPLKYNGECFMADMNDIYKEFWRLFLCKENRPTYKGKFIFFDMNNNIKLNNNGKEVQIKLSKPERFYHIISLESKKKYIMYPCANDRAIECCKNECKLENSIEEFRLLDRTECYYRLARINRIVEVINLANDNDIDIQEWSEVEMDKKRNKVYKSFIRYKHRKDDFIIILKEERQSGQVKNYRFITAFPLFSKENKEEYDKKYKNFINKK